MFNGNRLPTCCCLSHSIIVNHSYVLRMCLKGVLSTETKDSRGSKDAPTLNSAINSINLYVAIVEALCAEHGINLMKADDDKKLGEWAGLCKIDREGKARKVVGRSCVVVKDYGKESQALDVLQDYSKSKR